MARLQRSHALTLGLALVTSACSGSGSDGGGSGGTQIDSGSDTSLEVGFGPGADAGANADTGSGSEDTALPGQPLGAACTSPADCASGTCLEDERFPGGLCTIEACGDNSDCGLDAACVIDGDSSYCAATCANRSACRNGFDCLSSGAGGDHACVPEGAVAGVLVDGEACTADGDCRGGACILSADWPDGYCTTVDCNTFEDCASDGENNRCLIQRGGTNYCVRMCDQSSDCRDGYVCEPLGGGAAYCAPNPFQPPDIDVDAYPFDIICQDTNGEDLVSFDYTVADDTVAYMVTPFAADGRSVVPYDIARPEGDPINLRGANQFQLAGSQLFGFLNPTVVPATPDFTDQLEAGLHTYSVETDSARICHYLLEESTLGTQLDINMYLVGVTGIDAEGAPDDPDITAMLGEVEAIYSQAGIHVGQVRFFDLTPDQAAQYSVLRDDNDLDNLVALSEIPGDTMDEVLSANIFFVRSISDGTGAIGIALGLPGPAGLHGTGASGVVFTSEFLGQTFDDRFSGGQVDGDIYTGVVFAHEVGHYLGLFHTSEQFGGGYDPLSDTPECGNNFPDGCDDLTNVMFPLAGIDHTVISEAQGFVMSVNPLTKE